MNSTRIRQQTLASITQRYEAQASHTLRDFLCRPETFAHVEPQQMAFIREHQREFAEEFAQPDSLAFLCDACVNATLRYTYARNQFLNFSDDYLAQLTRIYQLLFAHLSDMLYAAPSRLPSEFRAAVRQHHARLRHLFGAYCQAMHPAAFAEHPFLESVCCGEYSAPLQLHLLGVAPESLREPILDLGCGSRGEVVTYLRKRGCQAIGLDRMAPNLPGFVRADWFSFEFQEQAWGTILAHQSFSTHFLHSHLHAPRLAEDCAKTYLAILNSLRPGGAFCYAPGLPFFEPHIHALSRYRVTLTPITATNLPASLRAIAYAVRVTTREHPANASCSADA